MLLLIAAADQCCCAYCEKKRAVYKARALRYVTWWWRCLVLVVSVSLIGEFVGCDYGQAFFCRFFCILLHFALELEAVRAYFSTNFFWILVCVSATVKQLTVC